MDIHAKKLERALLRNGGIFSFLEILEKLDKSRQRKHCEFLHRILLLKGGKSKSKKFNLKRDQKSLLHLGKISIYFLKGDVCDDYMHKQILKIAFNFRKNAGKDYQLDLMGFYRDLLDYLQFENVEILPASYLDWVQDYIDISKKVIF